jgi:hypothetical protein
MLNVSASSIESTCRSEKTPSRNMFTEEPSLIRAEESLSHLNKVFCNKCGNQIWAALRSFVIPSAIAAQCVLASWF